jgi:hypothetical protein
MRINQKEMFIMANESVKQFAKNLCGIVVFGTLMMLPRVLHVEYVSGEHEHERVGYYDAVRAIMETGMFASDKREMVAAMKQKASEDYYKAVISIANTDMFASDKIEMIKSLH